VTTPYRSRGLARPWSRRCAPPLNRPVVRTKGHQVIPFETYVDDFFALVARGVVEIYNEFSLQHELGIHFRTLLAPHHRVQFERPVGFFSLTPAPGIKKEIDIAVFSTDRTDRVAIELKFPRNGQYPEQMFSACQDIAFLEELVRSGFSAGLFVMAADDPLFYGGPGRDGIYAHFRAERAIHGVISKPTGAKDRSVTIAGTYKVSWRAGGPVRYTNHGHEEWRRLTTRCGGLGGETHCLVQTSVAAGR